MTGQAAERTLGVLFTDPATAPSVAGLHPAPTVVAGPDTMTDPLPLQQAAWWAVVEGPVQLRPDFVTLALEALDGEGHASESPAAAASPAAATGDASAPDAVVFDFQTLDGSLVNVTEWSPERARWQDYTGPVAVVRALVLASALAEGEDGARRRALRGSGPGVVRVRQPAYTAPDSLTASPMPGDLPYRVTTARDGTVHRRLQGTPSVSIIVPTRGSSGTVHGRKVCFVEQLCAELARTTAALAPQMVLVADTDASQSYVARWQETFGPRLTVVRTSPPYNFSAKVNAGVGAATGEFVAILNDDVAPISPDWLDNMVAVASEPDVGAVGALLLYEDGSIQHAGVARAYGGLYHVDSGQPLDDRDRLRHRCDRDVLAVTGACLVQRRSVWETVNGLDPAFPVNYNDVDYCERIRAEGLRIVQCNSARLYHYESRSRTSTAVARWEEQVIAERLGGRLRLEDPFTPPSRARPSGAVRIVGYYVARASSFYRVHGLVSLLHLARAHARWRWSRSGREGRRREALNRAGAAGELAPSPPGSAPSPRIPGNDRLA